MNIFFGLVAIVVGTLIVIKTEWIIQTFGKNTWAETHMGLSGGSRLLYKIIGVAAIFISLAAMTGLLGSFVTGTFGRFLGPI